MITCPEKPLAWTTWQKIPFRFFSIFFCLFIISPFWNDIIIWLGRQFFPFTEISFSQHGSGDALANYITIFLISLISLVATAAWTFIDKKERNYNQLLYWVTLIIRYYLALVMVNYGLAKVFKTQFPDPSASTLAGTFGDATPMGLAWTFFSYSSGYNYLMGFAELCGLLLFFRRTTLLGAIIILFVCINIMAINYSFDVPVKIFSTMLVGMTLLSSRLIPVDSCSSFFFMKVFSPPTCSPIILKSDGNEL